MRPVMDWSERLSQWWAHALCKVLGHRRPYRKFSCYVCPRCWHVVVPKRVTP